MATKNGVLYVDFGATSAKHFWAENVIPASERFNAQPNRANAIDAALHAWHLHEWIWHEQHPGEDTRGNPDYRKFRTDLIKHCPELEWIRDVADAGKHRGLGRPPVVRQVATGTRLVGGALGSAPIGVSPLGGEIEESTPLAIKLTNGRTHAFATVLSDVITYWKTKYFP